MRRLVGGAIAVLLAAAALAGGSAAQEAAGRYALAPDGDGFLRLDTATGAVSYCRLVDGRWTCEAADAGGLAAAIAAINERLGAIDTELGALRTAIETPAAPATIPDAALEPLRAEIAALSARVGALGAAQAALAENPVPAVPFADPGTAAALVEIGVRLAALDETVEGLRTAPPDPRLIEAIAALGTQLDMVVAGVEAIAPAPAVDPATEERLAAIEARLTEISVAIVELPLPLAADPGLSEMRAAIAALAEAALPLADLPATLGNLAARVDAIAEQQVALAAAASPGIGPPELAAVAEGLHAELDTLTAEVTRLGAAVGVSAEAAARIEAIEAALLALLPAADNAAAPLRVALDALAGELASLQATVEAGDARETLAGMSARIAALETAVIALVPAPVPSNVAAGAELRGTGVTPEPTTFAEELRRRLFELGAALRRGLGG